jgi:hypothetical protein
MSVERDKGTILYLVLSTQVLHPSIRREMAFDGSKCRSRNVTGKTSMINDQQPKTDPPPFRPIPIFAACLRGESEAAPRWGGRGTCTRWES